MERVAELAGFWTAHGFTTVSEVGGPITPMLALLKADDKREMIRIATENPAEGVKIGREWMENNEYDAEAAVLVADGYIHLKEDKTDALLIECRLYGEEPQSMVLPFPYRPHDDPDRFAIYRLKFVSFDVNEDEIHALAEAFFRGFDSHPEGTRLWEEFNDPSR